MPPVTYINTDELWPRKSGLVDGLSKADPVSPSLLFSSVSCVMAETGAWGWARVGNDISPYLVLWLQYGYTKRKFVSSHNSSPHNHGWILPSDWGTENLKT